VAGVAALVKSVNPSLTAPQVKNILRTSADVLPSLAGKVNTSGRLDAYKAVLAAQDTL
jgi:subtilisin family serine protease